MSFVILLIGAGAMAGAIEQGRMPIFEGMFTVIGIILLVIDYIEYMDDQSGTRRKR